VDGILLGDGIDERVFDHIKTAELELHSWMWTTNRGDAWISENHPDWYMVSRSGKSCFDDPPYVDYYRWVSPVIPGVQSYLKDKVAELAAHPAVSGVHLDYVRYPDVILPRGLWDKYGLDQTTELPDYDFCYGEHTRKAFKDLSGRDPLEIEDPSADAEWVQFRYDSVTRLVEGLAEVAHNYGKQISAAVFPTPTLARKICRQDWDKWPLDAVFPMLYHGFYREELAWILMSVDEDVKSVNFPVYAGLYLPDLQNLGDFMMSIQKCFQSKAAGISLFGNLDDEHLKCLGEAKSGWRAP
jgi:uncharacterized lipoprotein YddW (UPF0748 family)